MEAKSIPLHPVDSSQIHSLGHDPDTNTLAVRFKDRATGAPRALYHYRNVSAEKYLALRNADSIGSHFGKHIKPYVVEFPYTRIESAPATA